MKYIDAEKLKAEIEKRKAYWHYKPGLIKASYAEEEDSDILSLLDSLEVKEVNQPSLPPNLDEAAEEYGNKNTFCPDEWTSTKELSYLFSKAFKAGAKWEAGQGWKEVDNQNYPTPDKKKIYVVYTKEHYHLARVINHPQDDDLYQWMCTEFPNYRYDMCEGDK